MNKKLLILVALMAALTVQAQEAVPSIPEKDSLGIYYTPDELPLYPGGNQAMHNDLQLQLNHLDFEEKHRFGLSMVLTLSMVIDEQGHPTNFAPHWMLVRPAREVLPSEAVIGEEAAREVLTQERLDHVQQVYYDAVVMALRDYLKPWKPARHKGKKVKCHYSIPLRF